VIQRKDIEKKHVLIAPFAAGLFFVVCSADEKFEFKDKMDKEIWANTSFRFT